MTATLSCENYSKTSQKFQTNILRFTFKTFLIADFSFFSLQLLFLPIIIYVPALAMNQVSGIDIHLIGGIVCIICVFYTLVGGIKAVVTTDAWQICIMFVSVVVVTLIGTYNLGGPANVFDRAFEGGRIKIFE
jgi:solute carrier family 5 (sodium-coupled monocarboxylate transporter), member 8/12